MGGKGSKSMTAQLGGADVAGGSPANEAAQPASVPELPRGSHIKTSWAELYELGEKVGGPDPTSPDRTTNYEITDLPLNAGLGTAAKKGVYGGRIESANGLKLGHTYVVDAYNHQGGILAVYAGTERGYFGNDSVGLVFRAIGGSEEDSFEIQYFTRVVSGPDAKIAGEVYSYRGSQALLKRRV